MTHLVDILAAHVVQTDPRAYDAATVRKMQVHVLDTLGVTIAGSRSSETARTLAALSLHKSRRGQAGIWGTELHTDRRTAALINGVSANAYELDDSGGCDHSGAVVIPAAIAWAEGRSTAVTGMQFLHACIMGYEVGRRVLEASGGYDVHNGLGWHSTGTCGVFGAATAVSLLQQAKPAELAQTLGIACSFASGTGSFIHDGSQTKKLHAGRAAEGGLMAAQLAQARLSGPVAVFDADTWGNFWGTFGGPQAVPALLTDAFGERWRINRCALKPYATCRGSHSGIDAIGELLSTYALTAEDIAAVHISISAFQFGMCGSTAITTRAEAQMSLPYAIAARLVYGKVFLAELEDAAWSAPVIRDWLGRTTVQIDPEMAADTEPTIAITTHRGQTYHCAVEHPLGSPEQPLTDEQVIAKFRDLVAPVLRDAQAEALIDMVFALPQATTIQPLIEALAVTV